MTKSGGIPMAKESIYQYINRMVEEYPGLPYSFQNIQVAGSRDVKFLLWEDEVPFLIKEKFAKTLMDQILKSMETEIVSDELKKILDNRPVFLYLTKLVRRIKLCLSEKIIDENKLYSFAINLATSSEKDEEVKLGMLILGFFENDITIQILKVLGMHSALTIYALEASRNFHCSNQFAFELAENTAGFGRLASLYMLEPITKQQKLWILREGAKNEVVPNLSAIMSLEKVDMADFYSEILIDESNYESFSLLLAYGFEKNQLSEIPIGKIIVPKYIKAAYKYGQTFIDLAALSVILKGMDHSFHIDLKNELMEIIKNPKWINIALGELNEPTYHTSLIIMVLETLKLKSAFAAFIPLFQRDLFDMDVLKQMLMDNPDLYGYEVFGYLQNVLPKAVFNDGPKEISEEDIDSSYKPDIWLMYLLITLRRKKENEEEFFIQCLTCRFPGVRIEAIHALRVFKLNWSDNVIPALEAALEIEPVKSIKKRLLRLIGKSGEGREKEQRYVDISNVQIIPSHKDLTLMDSEIAGTFFRDMLVVEGQLEEGDILYLLREPDNQYDHKAILVVAEDGYVLGYVPKIDNPLPASMIDSGERLYAILKSSSVDFGRPEIAIMISKGGDLSGKVIKFPRSYS